MSYRFDLQMFGPAAAWAVPAGIGLVGNLIGGNQQNHAAQQANQAAQQDATNQTALTQQQEAIYNQILQNFNQNYQPLEGQLAGSYQQQLSGVNMPGIEQSYLNTLNPSQTDSMTGIPVQAALQNAVQYLGDPSGTLAGMNGVGGTVLNGLLNGGTGGSNLSQLTPGAIGSMQGSNNALMGLGQGTIGGLNQSVVGNGQGPGVGADALAYYQNQAKNGGIDPMLINNALGQQQQTFDQSLNDIRNSMGGRSNTAALLQNLGVQDQGQTANMLAQLTGQSQQLRNQAEGNALASGQSIDQGTMQRLLSQFGVGQQLNSANQQTQQNVLGAGGNLDQQMMQYLLGAQQTAGGIDAQTQQMLQQAYQLANQGQQQQLGNLGTAYNVGQGTQQNIQNYLTQGNNSLTGTATGIGGVASTYGQAGTAAANNAANASNNAAANNPFSGLGGFLANSKPFQTMTQSQTPSTNYGTYTGQNSGGLGSS